MFDVHKERESERARGVCVKEREREREKIRVREFLSERRVSSLLRFQKSTLVPSQRERERLLHTVLLAHCRLLNPQSKPY